MPIAVDPKRTTSVVFPEDEELERPPRFLLSTPDLKTYDRAQSDILAAQDGEKLPSSFFALVLRGSLTGWEDWFDDSGSEVPYEVGSDGRPTDETLMRITYSGRVFLTWKALSLAIPTKAESK